MRPATASKLRIAGMVLAALIVLGLAVPAVGQLIRHTDEQAFELSPGLTTLTVDSAVGDITVHTVAAHEEPLARATVQSSFRSPRIEEERGADSATLTSDCPGVSSWFNVCDVSWEIFVPDGASVDLRTSLGDVTAVGLTGPVRARSSVGDVTVEDSHSPSLDLDSSVGDVTVTALAPGSVTARSSTGDVTVHLPDDGSTYRLVTRTSLGDTRRDAREDSTSSYVIDLSTSVGDITITQP